MATVGSPFKNGTAFLSSGWLLFTVAQHIPHSISRGVNSITRTCAIFSIHLRKLIGEQHAAAVVAKMRFIVCRHSVYKLPRDSAGCAPSSITVLHPYAHILSLYARWKLLVCPQLAAAQLSSQPSRPPTPLPLCSLGRRDVGHDSDRGYFCLGLWFGAGVGAVAASFSGHGNFPFGPAHTPDRTLLICQSPRHQTYARKAIPQRRTLDSLSRWSILTFISLSCLLRWPLWGPGWLVFYSATSYPDLIRIDASRFVAGSQ